LRASDVARVCACNASIWTWCCSPEQVRAACTGEKAMLINKASEMKASDITDKTLYLARRQFLRTASTTALAVAAAGVAPGLWGQPDITAQTGKNVLEGRKSLYNTDEALTPYKDVTHYNNFYELSTDKYAPATLAPVLRTTLWSVAVEGEIAK